MFADGKRVGEHGLKWLKIHCANLMGKDKATIPEKLEFVEANLGLIRAIAENPLQNRVAPQRRLLAIFSFNYRFKCGVEDEEAH